MLSSATTQPAGKSLTLALSQAGGDCRVLAVVYLGLGLAALAMLAAGLGGTIASSRGHILAVAASTGICLLAPGTAYLIEAIALHRRRQWAVEIGPWTVAAHLVIAAGMLLLVNLDLGLPEAAAIPAGASLFLIPASAAFLIHTRQARRAIRAFAAVHGFSPLLHGRSQAQRVDIKPPRSD